MGAERALHLQAFELMLWTEQEQGWGDIRRRLLTVGPGLEETSISFRSLQEWKPLLDTVTNLTFSIIIPPPIIIQTKTQSPHLKAGL